MNDEQGYTLIEILVALSLSIIVFAVASLTYFSLQMEWNNTSQNYQVESEKSLTIRTLTDYLSHAPEMYRIPSTTHREWRFKSGTGTNGEREYKYYSIVYGNLQANDLRTLTLYEISKESYDSRRKIDYSTPTNYVNAYELTNHLSPSPPFTIQTNDAEIPENPEQTMGKQIVIKLPFETERSFVNGNREKILEIETIQIKLLNDKMY